MELNNTILKHSNKYKHNATKKKIVIEVVNEFLYRLNSLIETAHKNHKTCIIVNLPKTISIPDGINYKECQVEIYYNIVMMLEKKDYIVNIRLSEKNDLIKISWSDGKTNSMDDMLKKIKEIKISNF